MGEYSIVFARSARHELEVLDPAVIRRILPKIESLADAPRPHGGRKLTGEKYLWRESASEITELFTQFSTGNRAPCAG